MNSNSLSLSFSLSPSLRSTTNSRNTTTTPGITKPQGRNGVSTFVCQSFWRALINQHVRILRMKGCGVVTPWFLHTPPGWSSDQSGARHVSSCGTVCPHHKEELWS